MGNHTTKISLLLSCFLMVIPCAADAINDNNDASKLAKIIEFHPNCAPEVIEDIELINPLVSKNGSVSVDTKEAMRRAMLVELREVATEKGADSIILNSVKVLLPEAKKTAKLAVSRFRMKMAAQLLRLCPDDQSLSQRLTPFDHTGNRQFGLGNLSREEREIVIRQPGTEQPDIAALNSANISLKDGVYDMTLGAKTAQLQESFGYPTAEFQLSDNTQLRAYGRNHWFYLQNDELVKVTTENEYFNRNLINLLPFDDRFDEAHWQLFDQYGKNAKETAVVISSESQANTRWQLKPLWRKNNAQEKVLKGFDYVQKGFTPPAIKYSHKIPDYGWLIEFLSRAPEARQRALEKRLENTLGKIYIDRVTITYLMDKFMRFTVVNGQLKTVTIEDSILKTAKDSKTHQWRLRNLRQNQTIDNVKAELAKTDATQTDDSLSTNDSLSINYNDYSVKYHFFEHKDQLKLYQVSFSVF